MTTQRKAPSSCNKDALTLNIVHGLTVAVHWCFHNLYYELHWRSALMFVQVALGLCTALVCRVHSGRLPIRQMMQTEQSRRKTGAAIQLRPTKTLPTNAKYKYKAILNTNTYQCKIQIQKCKIQIQSNSESPNHKADRQNTNRIIAKDSEGCPVSLSVSQVNFISVMI